jgi:hypothetical protein
MLICIGVDESILPLDYEDEVLGNLWLCITESGFLVLDLHFSLSKSSSEISDTVDDMQDRVEATAFSMHKLFAFKQMLLGKTSLYGGIKWHSILHFPYYRDLFASIANFEMIVYEHSHVALKARHRRTARKRHGNFDELVKRMLSSDLCSVLRDSFMDSHPVLFEKFNYKKTIVDKSKSFSVMKTENDVEFYAYKHANQVELMYDERNEYIFCLEKDVATLQLFTNKLLPFNSLENLILNSFPPDFEDDINRWKEHQIGILPKTLILKHSFKNTNFRISITGSSEPYS